MGLQLATLRLSHTNITNADHGTAGEDQCQGQWKSNPANNSRKTLSTLPGQLVGESVVNEVAGNHISSLNLCEGEVVNAEHVHQMERNLRGKFQGTIIVELL